MCYHIVRHAGCHSSPLDGTVNIFLISLITFVSVPSLPGAALVERGALTVPAAPAQARRGGVRRAVPGRAPA